jgi:hypothetical protein
VLEPHGEKGLATVELRGAYIEAREFTAASRGDGDVYSYFGMINWPESDPFSPVRSRAVLRDRVTGKTVLLWRSGRYDSWDLDDKTGYESDLEWEEDVCDGVFQASMTKRPPDWSGIGSDDWVSLKGFYVSPLKGQQGSRYGPELKWCAISRAPHFTLRGADLIARLIQELQA